MRHLFYLTAFLPILWELSCIANPKRIASFRKSYKGLKWDDYKPAHKNLAVLQFGYLIWIFIGLLTFQWPVFLLMFLLGLIPKSHWLLIWVDSFITLLILLFILLNNYQLHIDISNITDLIRLWSQQ